MCGLHRLEQGLPKGLLPPVEDRSAGGFHSRTQAPDFYRHILGVQLDKKGKGRLEENCLHHNQGLYCYEVMSFRLKNVRATY